jgi:PhnB protein
MTTNTYLHFNGNCQAAFDYYVQHLGAKLVMSFTYADAPKQPGQPAEQPGCQPESKDKIMHARIQLGDGFLMGSDCPPGHFHELAGFSVSLNTPDPQEAERAYRALSAGGEVRMELAETFWAHRFAMVKDRFGVPWMINCEKESY